PQELLAADSGAIYAEPGYLLFVRGTTLLAQRFDASSLKLSGDAMPVGDGVLPDGEVGPTHYAHVSVSRNILAFRPSVRTDMRLQWVDRSGRLLSQAGTPGEYDEPALSPDRSRIAVDRKEEGGVGNAIWVLDVERGASSRISPPEKDSVCPVWLPN